MPNIPMTNIPGVQGSVPQFARRQAVPSDFGMGDSLGAAANKAVGLGVNIMAAKQRADDEMHLSDAQTKYLEAQGKLIQDMKMHPENYENFESDYQRFRTDIDDATAVDVKGMTPRAKQQWEQWKKRSDVNGFLETRNIHWQASVTTNAERLQTNIGKLSEMRKWDEAKEQIVRAGATGAISQEKAQQLIDAIDAKKHTCDIQDEIDGGGNLAEIRDKLLKRNEDGSWAQYQPSDGMAFDLPERERMALARQIDGIQAKSLSDKVDDLQYRIAAGDPISPEEIDKMVEEGELPPAGALPLRNMAQRFRDEEERRKAADQAKAEKEKAAAEKARTAREAEEAKSPEERLREERYAEAQQYAERKKQESAILQKDLDREYAYLHSVKFSPDLEARSMQVAEMKARWLSLFAQWRPDDYKALLKTAEALAYPDRKAQNQPILNRYERTLEDWGNKAFEAKDVWGRDRHDDKGVIALNRAHFDQEMRRWIATTPNITEDDLDRKMTELRAEFNNRLADELIQFHSERARRITPDFTPTIPKGYGGTGASGRHDYERTNVGTIQAFKEIDQEEAE